MSDKEQPTVLGVSNKLIKKLDQMRGKPSTRATLAKLRQTAGRPINEATAAWPILFENLPKEFLSKYSEPSYEESAILLMLQLYALHQQGRSESVWEKKGEYWENIGTSFRKLRKGKDKNSMDRRFNVLVSSTTFEELAHHLRQFIKLLKSRTTTPVDYPKLASDLYWFLVGDPRDLMLRWTR